MKRMAPLLGSLVVFLGAAAFAGENIIWDEDFASYDVGDPAPKWGKDLLVLKGSDGRKYLASQVPGRHRAGARVDLGTSFDLEFDWTSFSLPARGNTAPWVRIPVALTDADGKTYSFEVGNWGLLTPGRPVVEFDKESRNRFRLERRGEVAKFYNNGKYIATAEMADVGAFKSFEIEVPVSGEGQSQMFTAFRASRKGGPAPTTVAEPAPGAAAAKNTAPAADPAKPAAPRATVVNSGPGTDEKWAAGLMEQMVKIGRSSRGPAALAVELNKLFPIDPQAEVKMGTTTFTAFAMRHTKALKLPHLSETVQCSQVDKTVRCAYEVLGERTTFVFRRVRDKPSLVAIE